jgi:hypothetical protein
MKNGNSSDVYLPFFNRFPDYFRRYYINDVNISELIQLCVSLSSGAVGEKAMNGAGLNASGHRGLLMMA